MNHEDLAFIADVVQGHIETANSKLEQIDLFKTDAHGQSIALISLWMLGQDTAFLIEKLQNVFPQITLQSNNADADDPKTARDEFIRVQLVPLINAQLLTFLKNLAPFVGQLEVVNSTEKDFFLRCAEAVLSMLANDNHIANNLRLIAVKMHLRAESLTNRTLTFDFSARIAPHRLRTALRAIPEEETESDTDSDLEHDNNLTPPTEKKNHFYLKLT